MEGDTPPSIDELLTPREVEALELLRLDLTNEQIAQRMGISLNGAKYHVSEILGKLGVASREEAARWEPSERPWWAGAAVPIAWLWRRVSVSWLWTGAAGITAIAVLAGFGLLVWGLLRTDGDAAGVQTAVRVETVVREYLRAISEADAELFCASIDPQIGFFFDEENCLRVMRYQTDEAGRISPRYKDQFLSTVTSELSSFKHVDVSGDEAVALATIRWTGEGPPGVVDLGESELSVRFVQSGGHWRIASFGPAPDPDRDDEQEAVAVAVREYYEALNQSGPAQSLAICEATALAASNLASVPWCRGRIGYMPGPETFSTSPNEHRTGSVLARIADVEIKGDFAMVTLVAHTTDNGALGHSFGEGPDLFAREDGEWGHVRNYQHEAWALFEG